MDLGLTEDCVFATDVGYSRRFATATARTASFVTANDVGHWDQKHPKVLIVGKKREEFDSHV